MILSNRTCEPCEGGTVPLTTDKEDEYLNTLHDWNILRDDMHKIRKVFTFKGFMEAIAFINKVAVIADEEGHHPNISIYYNKVHIELFTHAIGGLSINDFILAAKIDQVRDRHVICYF